MQAPHTPSRLSNYHTLGRVFLPYSINYLLHLVNRGQIFSYGPYTNHGRPSLLHLMVVWKAPLAGSYGWKIIEKSGIILFCCACPVNGGNY
jgi:hypothetical protein